MSVYPAGRTQEPTDPLAHGVLVPAERLPPAAVRVKLAAMQLSVPDELAAQTGCSPEELRFELALGLYLDGRLTAGSAARLAGLTRLAFLEELGRRRIPLPYDEADLAEDARALRELYPGQPSPAR